jgi:hypothetical protein
MKKAQKVIKLGEELAGSPVNIGAIKQGDWVMFKMDGKLNPPQNGNQAIVVQTHADRGTLDVKVGAALVADVPAGELVKIDNPGAPQGQPSSAGNGGEVPAAASQPAM